MLKRLALALVLIAVLASAVHAQDFNSKAIDSIRIRIVQTGQLEVDGQVYRANLSLYIPQEGLKKIQVASSQPVRWNYRYDEFGNRMVSLEWSNPSGIVTYSVETVVENTAKYLSMTSRIGNDPNYLKTTSSIVINDKIRKAAYPYDISWENVAKLTQFVYDYMDYDISVLGARRPSDWAYENRRGVCVEHTNLLAALLRASGIPTRYVVGYAYSPIDKKLIGHTWVEVLAEDESWVPFDPTWLQGGYIDAAHIKTANLLDDNQKDTLVYFGTGNIKWTRGDSFTSTNSDMVEILDYTLKNITSIELEADSVAIGGYGFIKANISSPCSLHDIKAQSCVDDKNTTVLSFIQPERKLFSCGSKTLYWFFREAGNGKPYICPVTIYDQAGTTETVDVRAARMPTYGDVSISGPDVVAVNERFTLTASGTGFIFYSPEMGEHSGREWELSASRPGEYHFYLYSNGNLATKEVRVVERKEFDLSFDAPDEIKVGSIFQINITARRIGAAKTADLVIEFDGQRKEETISFGQDEQKAIYINLTSLGAGQKVILVSLQADSLTPYSKSIVVKSAESGVSFLQPFFDFFTAIANFFAGLF